MAAGALSSQRRVAIAAVVMTALLAALLGAWYVTGAGDVRARQLAAESAPVAVATARAGELARQLRGELDQLVTREARRPYFHYQNLFHDPKASAGPSVTPSPLASGPDDPLVLGYFQIDVDAHVTTPAINDEFPQLSEVKHLVEHRAFRDAVAQLLAKALVPERAKPGTLVASIDPPGHGPPTGRSPGGTSNGTTESKPRGGPPEGAVEAATPANLDNTGVTIEIDPSSYAQNNNANAVYGQNVPHHVIPVIDTGVRDAAPDAPPPPPPDAATREAMTTTIEIAPPPPPDLKKPPRPRPVPPRPVPPVTISISALEWHTLPFTGGPSLVAVRQVQTPDGNFTQGFVVDRAALTRWLADHGDDLVAELHTGTTSAEAEIIPGWELAVRPNPRAVAAAAIDAARIATGFLIKFVIVAAIAVLAALLVVWLVARAE
ncbi:MAG: hypothetical protein ABI678_10090, partial [Kofleriaceae bacterium]